MVGLKVPVQIEPHSLKVVPRGGTPDTVTAWKAMAESFLTNECCAFHRNVEISSRYAWMYTLRPEYFKWAGMAAIASHHVRLALFPIRLDTDPSGYVDIPHSLVRPKLLLMRDVNTIRATNNAIFDDIFWVHLAYITGDSGIDRLRKLLRADRSCAPLLSGFESIDQGRCILSDPAASTVERREAGDLIWQGNVQLLEHEQRALVQPRFDHLSCAFASIISIGSATTFEVRGVRQDVAFFTSFYLSSLPRSVARGSRDLPRITRFDDRWRWVVTSVVPRFRKFDADMPTINATMQRITDEARVYASAPCMLPRLSPTGSLRRPRTSKVFGRSR